MRFCVGFKQLDHKNYSNRTRVESNKQEKYSRKKDDVFEQLHQEVTKVGVGRDIVILGNLNSRTETRTSSRVIGQSGKNVVNDNGHKLIRFYEQNELNVMNGFSP